MERDFRSIIVRMPNWVGELIMATPILEDLRTTLPNAEITAMCLSHIAPLLEHDPAIDKLFHFSKSKKFFRRIEERNIVEKLKKGRYDLGIILTNSFSSAWHFWRGNVHNKTGFKTHYRTPFLDIHPSFPKDRAKQHLVTTYKTLLTSLNIPISQTAPRLILLEEEIQGAWKFVERFGITKKNKIFGISPGVDYGSARCYFPKRFREIAQCLIKTHPSYVVLFFGKLSQKDLMGKTCANLPYRVVNLAGQTSLRELMALIKICSVFLTNDSGPMHIADSVETPLVALFGPTNPVVSSPYRQSNSIIQKKIACAPCLKKRCFTDHSCMAKISVEEIVEALLEKLKESAWY